MARTNKGCGRWVTDFIEIRSDDNVLAIGFGPSDYEAILCTSGWSPLYPACVPRPNASASATASNTITRRSPKARPRDTDHDLRSDRSRESERIRKYAHSFSAKRVPGKLNMTRCLVTLVTAVLLASSAVPSFADHHGGGHGGGWRASGWQYHGRDGGWGVGPVIGLGVGLELGRSQRLPITVATTMAMVTIPIREHSRLRFGIGAIRIRRITLQYRNARFRGNRLFNNV